MTLRTATRLGRGAADRPKVIKLMRQIVDESGVLDLFENAKNSDPPTVDQPKRGRPAHLPEYSVKVVLIVLLHMAWEGATISWRGIVERLWFGYTSKDMKRLGLKGWRDKLRAADMRNPSRQADADALLWSEYNRFKSFVETAFACIDSTLLPANRRHSLSEKVDAGADDPKASERELLIEALNLLINGPLLALNARWFPNLPDNDPLKGILASYKGHIAVDEHEIPTAITTTSTKEPYVQLAKTHGHMRRLKVADAVGLTTAVTAYLPSQPPGPNIALAIALDTPMSANAEATMTCLDTLDRQGLRPETASRARQYCVVDRGYVSANGLNQGLVDRGYNLVGEYPSNWGTTADLSPGGSAPGGPYLFQGAIVCPGAGDTIHQVAPLSAPDDDCESGAELLDHQQREQFLEALIMPSNGRMEVAPYDKVGRPSHGQAQAQDLYRQEVRCPAAAGNAKCPIVKKSLKLNKPLVPNPPTNNPAAACRKDTSVVTLTGKQLKIWQTHMSGTWTHADIYRPIRSDNERFFSGLVDPQNTNTLDLGCIKPVKNNFFALAVAANVAVANIHALFTWREQQLNTGRAPRGPRGPIRRRRRKNLINTELKFRSSTP